MYIKNEVLAKAYVITGPTSGIGYETALEVANYGTVILVGRSLEKLLQVQKTITERGKKSVNIICDISDINSVRNAAQQIIDLKLPIYGLINNAGIMPQKPTKSVQGWDITFATNHLGAFALTEALTHHLSDGANVVYMSSAAEDPESKPTKAFRMKGSRFISVEASVRGEWKPGGTKLPGIDAYATSKQCMLAASMAFSRENTRLRFNAIEPGMNGGTGLTGTTMFSRFLFDYIFKILPPFSRYASTPQQSAKLITKILTDESGTTGVYFDHKGEPMQGSIQVRNIQFQDQIVAQTRTLLSKI
jgi:NAD(P)-dependent dehydrogenase (short-subunit alcohol dehydrogenase family)